MNKFVSCICICLALVVAVMPLCAFKCADVPNAPAIVNNRPVMASNRSFIEPLVAPPLNQWEVPPFDSSINADISGTYVLDFTLPVSDFGYVGNITFETLGSYDVGINQYFYFLFMGDFSLYTYDTNELVYSFVFDSSQYKDARLSFGVNDVGSYFFTLKGLTVNFVNSTIFELSNFDKYLLVFDFILPNTNSLYAFYDNLSSRIVNIPFLASDGGSGFVSSNQLPVINGIYKGQVFYTYYPPQPTVIEQLIDILVAGVSAFGTNIGQGLTDIVVNVFVDTSQETFVLTTFGGVIAVFAGLALAVGLSKLVTSFIMRLGGKE